MVLSCSRAGQEPAWLQRSQGVYSFFGEAKVCCEHQATLGKLFTSKQGSCISIQADMCMTSIFCRRVMMLVKAGAPVESTIDLLMPLLEKGDIIIDGGNEWYENTEHRQKKVAEKGLMYLGMGVSGGEEGARNGESPVSFKSANFYLSALASCKPKSQWRHQRQICSSTATNTFLNFTIMRCFAAFWLCLLRLLQYFLQQAQH